MKRSQTKKLSLLFSTLVISGSLAACPWHFGSDLQSEQTLPGAEQMLFRTIFLEKHNEVEPVDELAPAPSFQRAAWWLRLLARELGSAKIGDAYIVLVDVPLWSQLESSNPGSIKVDISPPEDLQNVIMMTQVSLNALVSRTLTFEDAIEMGLVQIEQGSDELTEKLRNLPVQ